MTTLVGVDTWACDCFFFGSFSSLPSPKQTIHNIKVQSLQVLCIESLSKSLKISSVPILPVSPDLQTKITRYFMFVLLLGSFSPSSLSFSPLPLSPPLPAAFKITILKGRKREELRKQMKTSSLLSHLSLFLFISLLLGSLMLGANESFFSFFLGGVRLGQEGDTTDFFVFWGGEVELFFSFMDLSLH